MLAVLASIILVLPPTTYGAAGSAADRARPDEQTSVVDISGHWQLNVGLSDRSPQPGSEAEPGERRAPEGRGRRPGGGGGFPGGMGGMRGGGMRGGPGGARPDPDEMAKMRDAMRAALEAPAEMIVTRKDDEVVFTAAGTGDVTRILVTGKKMKTTAGGIEHEVKAAYKNDALLVESEFGRVKVVDTWRVSPDGRQLERVTRIEGNRVRSGSPERQIRRVYQRVEG
jgi:hypothetical protein